MFFLTYCIILVCEFKQTYIWFQDFELRKNKKVENIHIHKQFFIQSGARIVLAWFGLVWLGLVVSLIDMSYIGLYDIILRVVRGCRTVFRMLVTQTRAISHHEPPSIREGLYVWMYQQRSKYCLWGVQIFHDYLNSNQTQIKLKSNSNSNSNSCVHVCVRIWLNKGLFIDMMFSMKYGVAHYFLMFQSVCMVSRFGVAQKQKDKIMLCCLVWLMVS